MRFSEWLDKMDKQQKKLNDLALSEVSETISVENKVISITLGKSKYETLVDNSQIALRFLRPLYTNNKEEFDAMLEAITNSVDKVTQATEVILTAMSEEAIPGAVIARMKGEKTSGEPADLVESMTEKLLNELLYKCRDELGLYSEDKATVFNSFEVTLGSIGGLTLSMEFKKSLNLILGIKIQDRGRIEIQDQSGRIFNSIKDIEAAMFFLANYGLIEQRFLKFIEQVKMIKE